MHVIWGNCVKTWKLVIHSPKTWSGTLINTRHLLKTTFVQHSLYQRQFDYRESNNLWSFSITFPWKFFLCNGVQQTCIFGKWEGKWDDKYYPRCFSDERGCGMRKRLTHFSRKNVLKNVQSGPHVRIRLRKVQRIHSERVGALMRFSKHTRKKKTLTNRNIWGLKKEVFVTWKGTPRKMSTWKTQTRFVCFCVDACVNVLWKKTF